jgi:hypothetical protein
MAIYLLLQNATKHRLRLRELSLHVTCKADFCRSISSIDMAGRTSNVAPPPMLEVTGDLHVRSSLCSRTFAPLPWYLCCGMFQLGTGLGSGYSDDSVFDGRTDSAVYRGRDVWQCEAPYDTDPNERSELELQRSFRSYRQRFRGRNGCGPGHNNHHSGGPGI